MMEQRAAATRVFLRGYPGLSPRLLPVVALGVFVLLSGCTTAGTPRRSLSELRSALLAHDAGRAMRYIDVDSVVDGLARDMLLKYEKRADNPTEAVGVFAGRQAAPFVMPVVKRIAREGLERAIESGSELGYFHDIERSSVWYLNIAVEGDTALVTPKGKSDFAFRMARSKDGRWRIVEIVNRQAASEKPSR